MRIKAVELLLLVLFVSAFVGVVMAQEGSEEEESSSGEDQIDEAYACLDKQVEDNTINLEQAIFSALAGVPSAKVRDAINSEESASERCWPKSRCKVKDTAQVALAKKALGENRDEIVDWIMTQTGTATELTWYLQITIDDNKASECKVSYDSDEFTVSIGDDMKLSGGAGSCLSVSNDGNWLKVSNSCVEKEFGVKCDVGFKINLLYEKSSGGTIFVSSTTQSGTADTLLREKIKAKCFKEGGVCDYEASLWAVTAMYDTARDNKEFLPYLRVLADDNSRFFPSAFLVYIDGDSNDLYKTKIANKRLQKLDGDFWKVGSNEYYDTALALLALGGGEQLSTQGTKKYLLNQQTAEGCWNGNNIRDTAFLLYAGWPRKPTLGGGGGSIIGNGSGGGGFFDDGVETRCEEQGLFCVENRRTCIVNGGQDYSGIEYSCATHVPACCTEDVVVVYDDCFSNSGEICAFDQECTGSIVSASDGSCCVSGFCQEIDDGGNGGGGGGGGPGPEEERNLLPLILILGILILLVLIAIVYRKKIKLWWMKRKSKKKIAKGGPRGPPGGTLLGRLPPRAMHRPGPRFGSRPLMRPMMRRAPARVARKAPSAKDKEMDETMKKLKEMSK